MNAINMIDTQAMEDAQNDNATRSNEVWDAFFEVAPAGVAILDREMRYLEVSARWMHDFRIEGLSIKGRSHYEIFPEISERWRAIHRRCLAGATERCDADPFPRADGRVDWVRWEIRPWHRTDGTIGGIIIFSDVITDQVQADATLRMSEARYRVMFEQAPDAILVYDLNKEQFVDANASAELLFGCSRDELLRGGPQRFYLSEQPDGMAVENTFREHNQRVVAGQPVSFERRIRNANGAEIVCEVRLSRMPSAGGLLIRASMLDITQRKRAEIALQEQEAKYRGLVEQQISGIVIIKEDGTFAYVNPHFAKMAGYAPAELIGRSLFDTVPADVRDMVREGFFRNMKTENRSVQLAAKLVTRQGDTRDVLVNATMSAHEGRPASIAVVQDITDQTRTEKALRDSEQKFSTIFHDSPAGIAILDMSDSHKIVDVNRAWLDMLGFERDEVLGRTTIDLDLWVDPAGRDVMYKTISAPPGIWSGDIQMRRKDGTIIEDSLTMRRAEIGGRPFGIALGFDITERRRAERSLQRSNRALRTLTSANESLMRADSEQGLFEDMCKTVVEGGGYLSAWVGRVEHDEGKAVRPIASAGSGADYLSAAKVTWADTERGQGPTGVAARTGVLQINPDFATNPKMVPWRETARTYGYGSSIALPLKDASGVFGTLTIYAAEANAFDPEEVELLVQLSNDLAYGVTALRDRAGRATLERRMQAGMKATIGALSGAVEARDAYTAGHQLRVANLAAAIAGEMGLSTDRIEAILIAGQLHDIGKISVPAEFLSKPSRLTKGEFEVVKGHVEAGYEILKDIQFPWPIADMVRQHHERLDGSGYPLGLKGDAILPEAKILAVADVVEAMGTHRPYRPSRGIEAALAEIVAGKGRLFDAAVVEACLRLFHEKGFKLG